MRISGLAFVMLAVAVSAMAQTAAPKKDFLSAGDIQALVAKAKADRKGEAPTTTEAMVGLDKYQVNLEYRPIPAPANLHRVENELMVALEGSGTVSVGGTMAAPTEIDANNQRSPTIKDGKERPFAKGDVLMIPSNTPHQITAVKETMVLMTMRLPAGN